MQEVEAKRRRREKEDRRGRGRPQPGALQVYAELQALPDDDSAALGDRRSGTPSPHMADSACPLPHCRSTLPAEN